jgi:hypothetical protein
MDVCGIVTRNIQGKTEDYRSQSTFLGSCKGNKLSIIEKTDNERQKYEFYSGGADRTLHTFYPRSKSDAGQRLGGIIRRGNQSPDSIRQA